MRVFSDFMSSWFMSLMISWGRFLSKGFGCQHSCISLNTGGGQQDGFGSRKPLKYWSIASPLSTYGSGLSPKLNNSQSVVAELQTSPACVG